jgi:hypothetical protein
LGDCCRGQRRRPGRQDTDRRRVYRSLSNTGGGPPCEQPLDRHAQQDGDRLPEAQPEEHVSCKILAPVAGSTKGSAEGRGCTGCGNHQCRSGGENCTHGLFLSQLISRLTSIGQQAYYLIAAKQALISRRPEPAERL